MLFSCNHEFRLKSECLYSNVNMKLVCKLKLGQKCYLCVEVSKGRT